VRPQAQVIGGLGAPLSYDRAWNSPVASVEDSQDSGGAAGGILVLIGAEDPRVRPDVEALAKGRIKQKLQDILEKNGLKGLFAK
jgi:hypothetical protein